MHGRDYQRLDGAQRDNTVTMSALQDEHLNLFRFWVFHSMYLSIRLKFFDCHIGLFTAVVHNIQFHFLLPEIFVLIHLNASSCPVVARARLKVRESFFLPMLFFKFKALEILAIYVLSLFTLRKVGAVSACAISPLLTILGWKISFSPAVILRIALL